MSTKPFRVLGVIMAGGKNTRFGDHKAFAVVNGRRIADRVIEALENAKVDAIVVNANDSAYRELGLRMRQDELPDMGPLTGLYTSLNWAKERGDDGIAAVACDMPFPSASLLRAMLKVAPDHDAVLPESDSKRGLEPLFAYYSVRCLPSIVAALERDDRRMISFHDKIDLHRFPIDEVRTHGDPAIMFMNVNTPEDLETAERYAVEKKA